MKLRDLFKMNGINDGTRTLIESVVSNEVEQAVKDWNANTSNLNCVVIGGIALSYYGKPRSTTDNDLLFMSATDIPQYVEGFKRTRAGAFTHKGTSVEIEVLTPQSINMPVELAKAIIDNAKIENGIRIATPSGLVASKLKRFSRQDKADIEQLLAISKIDLSPYPIPQELLDKFNKEFNETA